MLSAVAPGSRTVYERSLNAHVITIEPPEAPLLISVNVEEHPGIHLLPELFLYNFDRDGNSIEFAFGEKEPLIESRLHLSYEIDPAVQKPPFNIQITHQLDTVKLQDFRFSVAYSILV